MNKLSKLLILTLLLSLLLMACGNKIELEPGTYQDEKYDYVYMIFDSNGRVEYKDNAYDIGGEYKQMSDGRYEIELYSNEGTYYLLGSCTDSKTILVYSNNNYRNEANGLGWEDGTMKKID